jgi:pyruvate dehydrogenase E2 component (dihydrolipoamide acetyltransferase)
MATAAPFLMPKLGLTMTEGLVAHWVAKPGQRIAAGEVVLVVETEKTATDVEAPADGTITEILVPAGDKVPVGTVLARWDTEEVRPRRIVATPLARRLARERGIDLAMVRGSGPGGRVKSTDVPGEPAGTPVAVSTADVVPAPVAHALGELVEPSPLHLAMARRVSQAKREIPHFYVSAEAEVSFLLEYRRKLNEVSGGPRITITHFLLKSVGQALVERPAANLVWHEGRMLRPPTADVGFAVSTERGVLMPVLRDAGRLPLAHVASRADELANQARQGRLGEQDMGGGTMGVSNVGMHHATHLTPIINPPHSAILGVGAVRELFRPGAGGEPRLRRELGLVLACDHRVFDGVAAMAFLTLVVELLQNPLRLTTPSPGR